MSFTAPDPGQPDPPAQDESVQHGEPVVISPADQAPEAPFDQASEQPDENADVRPVDENVAGQTAGSPPLASEQQSDSLTQNREPGPQSAAAVDHAVASGDVPVGQDPPSGDQQANQNPGQFRAQPVDVDGRNRLHEDDALRGGFVQIINGEKAGTIGVYLETLESGNDGYPTKILFRSRDAQAEFLAVDYSDVAAVPEYRGGR